MELLRPRGAVCGIRPFILAGFVGISYAGMASADGPGLQISPSIGLQQTYTDNTVGVQDSKPDLVTQISPGISINGETAHTKVNFNYQPSFNHFDLGNSPDRVDQNMNGTGSIGLPTDRFNMDVMTFANEAGASGNSSNQAGVLVPADNRILYFVGSAAPHLQERYRDIATIDAFYRVNSTNTSVEGQPLPGSGISSTNSLGQSAEVTIGSSESFGRLGLKLDFNHTSNSGSGSNTSSTTDVDILGVNYHFDRTYSLTGSIGYQKIDYPPNGLNQGYHNEGLTWTVGLSITPNELSAISLAFGKQQGAYSPSIQVAYALGPRTNLTVSYLVSVQNQLSSTLQNLRFLTYDQFGNAIDSRTGLPFNSVNQSFGSQNVLFRDKPALIAISHQFVRSSVTLTGQYEVRTSLSGPQQSSSALGVTINYSREFTPLIQGNVSLGYTETTSSGFGALTGHVQSISVSAALFYQLSDTTTINVIENYFGSTSGIQANSSKTQQLSVGLRKSF